MKKLLGIFSVLLLLGCTKQHVLHTYFGDIDTVVRQGIHDEDGQLYYIVNVEMIDSAICIAMGLDGAYFADFYKPSEDAYFRMMFGSDGGSSERIYYDPYSKSDSIDSAYSVARGTGD